MTKIIAVFNMAGGQGKTTLTLNLGYHLVQRGYRTLLMDMDGQASLTRFIGQDLEETQNTIFDTIFYGEPFSLITGIHGIDFVVSDTRMYELAEAMLQEPPDSPALLLHEALPSIQDNYDFILIDCPANLGIASTNALLASTHVLIPLMTETKGLEGIELLFSKIGEAQAASQLGLSYAGMVPTFHNNRINLQEDLLNEIKAFSHHMPVYPAIPIRADVKYAWDNYLPVALYKANSPVVPIFKKIVRGLEKL